MTVKVVCLMVKIFSAFTVVLIVVLRIIQTFSSQLFRVSRYIQTGIVHQTLHYQVNGQFEPKNDISGSHCQYFLQERNVSILLV